MKRNPKDDPELRKDEDEKDEAEGGEDEDEEMEKKIKKAKKSVDLSENDLQQSLDKLVTLAGDDADSRKQVLLSKAQEAELSKAEQAELFNLLGGQEEKDETLGEEITKGLEENDTLQKALDVSDYLQEQHTELVKSLQAMGDALAKSDNRQHEFNLVLAKAMPDGPAHRHHVRAAGCDRAAAGPRPEVEGFGPAVQVVRQSSGRRHEQIPDPGCHGRDDPGVVREGHERGRRQWRGPVRGDQQVRAVQRLESGHAGPGQGPH